MSENGFHQMTIGIGHVDPDEQTWDAATMRTVCPIHETPVVTVMTADAQVGIVGHLTDVINWVTELQEKLIAVANTPRDSIIIDTEESEY